MTKVTSIHASIHMGNRLRAWKSYKLEITAALGCLRGFLLHRGRLLPALIILCYGTMQAGSEVRYPPPAGIEGSTAIAADSALFVAWADAWIDYLPGSHVDETWQTPDAALGPSNPDRIVCLGRGGSITLVFAGGIGDGQGWDFAVFENAFSDTFLELAFVEVSTDGMTFARFPNHSLTSAPVGAFGLVNATLIDGFAGKYRKGFGTPFDLAVLRGVAGIDVDRIHFVRIIDIIGDGSTHDSKGNPIYDPYPTVGSAGFDLDAVAVINRAAITPLNPFADLPLDPQSGGKSVFDDWIHDSFYPYVWHQRHGWLWHASPPADDKVWAYDFTAGGWIFLLTHTAAYYSTRTGSWQLSRH